MLRCLRAFLFIPVVRKLLPIHFVYIYALMTISLYVFIIENLD